MKEKIEKTPKLDQNDFTSIVLDMLRLGHVDRLEVVRMFMEKFSMDKISANELIDTMLGIDALNHNEPIPQTQESLWTEYERQRKELGR